MTVTDLHARDDNLPFYQERLDLACAFRWTARLNMHEGVSNHFSLSVNGEGQAGGKLEGSYNGIASGQIEAELKGAFSLDASFDSVFSTTLRFVSIVSR